MRAFTSDGYGPPSSLETRDLPVPEPGADDVLVRVHAASVHRGDPLLIRGMPYAVRLMGYGLRRPKHPVPGVDLAGTVERVGANVAQLAPGDEVFGWCEGAFAEFACGTEQHFAPKPSNLTFAQAAAVPISGFAAIQAIRDRGEVKPGQRVLMVGASGGVGTFAVQIAKAYGADITGVCSTANVELVRSLADDVVDYTVDDFTRPAQAYDVILDAVGTRPLREVRRALTPRGTFVAVGSPTGRVIGGVGRGFRSFLLSPFVSQRFRLFLSRETHDDLIALTELIEAGKVTPVIGRTYLFEQTPEAVEYVDSGHAVGKVVITVST